MKQFFVLLLLGLPSFGHTFENPLGGLGGGRTSQSTLQVFAQRPHDRSFENFKTQLQVPVWQNDKSSFTMGLRHHDFFLRPQMTLPKISLAVPSRLSSSELTLGYSSSTSETESFGGRLSVGSSSDRTFSGSDVTSFAGSLFWSYVPDDDSEGRWIWSINYSNNNSFTTLPIPGVAYMKVSPGFVRMWGLPFAFVRWQPHPEGPWAFTAFYLITILKIEASYGPPYLNAFARFDWGQETWLRADRQEAEDRLVYDEKKFLIGGRFPVAKWLFVEAHAGWAFDRKFFEGKSMFRKRSGDARLEDGAFTGLNLRASF